MLHSNTLEAYIDIFSTYNEITPQLKLFINGLKALTNNSARMCKFTFDDKFYAFMIPEKYFDGVNTSSEAKKFIGDALVKKDIKVVSVYEFNEILDQVFPNKSFTYMATYAFLYNTYHDKCRHTMIKYYTLDNKK